MQSIARARVATSAFPADFVEVTPTQDDGSARYRDPVTRQVVRRDGSYGDPIRIGPNPSKHDCWLGDLVGVRAFDRPAVELETAGRLYEATWTVDEDRRVIAEGKLTPAVSFVDVV